VVGIQTETF